MLLLILLGIKVSITLANETSEEKKFISFHLISLFFIPRENFPSPFRFFFLGATGAHQVRFFPWSPSPSLKLFSNDFFSFFIFFGNCLTNNFVFKKWSLGKLKKISLFFRFCEQLQLHRKRNSASKLFLTFKHVAVDKSSVTNIFFKFVPTRESIK